MIKVVAVSKRFHGKLVLDRVSFEVDSGQTTVIYGPSGSGKSTLLRTLNRMESIDAGEIFINGVSLYAPEQNICLLRSRLGLVFQHCNLFSHLCALDNIVMPLTQVRRLPRAEARARALVLLRDFGLQERVSAFPDELSGGEKQRVAIARCLALEPAAILFDEPTSALDWSLRNEVAKTLLMLRSRGVTQLIVTHDLAFASTVGQRFLHLQNGSLSEVSREQLHSQHSVSFPSGELERATAGM